MEIFCSSPWVPAEWIAAHGFIPRGAWSTPLAPARKSIEGACSFAQHLADLPETAAGVVFTTACDQMRRAADAGAQESARRFLFNLPATWQTPAARRLYRSELERLGRQLVSWGGRAPPDGQLDDVVTDWDGRRQRVRQCLRATAGRAAAELLLDFFDSGSVPAAAPAGAGSAGVPLALVGGPVLRSQLNLFDGIARAGGSIVLNATEPGERCLLPPVPARAAEIPALTALADHYFENCVDVFHRPNTRLYEWLGPRLAERGVRGLVLWVHVGCDLWRAEAASLREAFDLPLLVLDEHETRGVAARDLTRLGAFVEALR